MTATNPALPILIPLLNPNEPEALLAALYVEEGQFVHSEDVICSLETTKSAMDVLAEIDGFVAGLRLQAGQTVRAGETLGYLAVSKDWKAPAIPAGETAPLPSGPGVPDQDPPAGLRITQPALALARQAGLDLARLPLDSLVTEKTVRSLLEQAPPAAPELSPPAISFDPQAILLYGGGGHGKILIDLLRALGTYRLLGIVDDGLPAGETVMGVPVLGGSASLADLHAQGVRLALNAVGGIGSVGIRIKVFRSLAQAGFVFPAVVHPRAIVEPGARLAPGAQVLAQAYVGSDARVGFGTIVSTGAIVSHDCVLGDYVAISPGAILAGKVQVGSGALVGMGATINLQVLVGPGAKIGNGATVKSDVPENGVVRAGAVWPET